jgi:hypothetical protein
MPLPGTGRVSSQSTFVEPCSATDPQKESPL